MVRVNNTNINYNQKHIPHNITSTDKLTIQNPQNLHQIISFRNTLNKDTVNFAGPLNSTR